ncbi:MAG TPA: ParA family protein [Acetobacteraceae bacterium]|nr:ParA family protein [Acetobacteraceae bacterium]
MAIRPDNARTAVSKLSQNNLDGGHPRMVPLPIRLVRRATGSTSPPFRGMAQLERGPAIDILMLAKQKGGVGASTLAREIGVLAASEGQRVVFIDLDPQASLSKWWNRRTADMTGRPNPALASPPPQQLLGALARLRETDDADLVIVDVPPSVHSYLLGVMRAADFILVPCRPTSDDFEALPEIVEMIEQSARRYAFVITQAPTGRRIRSVEDAVPILARQGRVAGVLRFRVTFPTAAAAGQTTTEFEPDGKAAAEIRELWGFVSGELKKTHRVAA